MSGRDFRTSRRIGSLVDCAVILLALSTACEATPYRVIVEPGADLTRLVAGAPPGATFVFLPGRHYTEGVVPKNDQTFEGQRGAVLSGAIRLGPFKADGAYWKAKGPPPLPLSHGSCDPKVTAPEDACKLREDLFLDGERLARVHSVDQVRERTWYQDRSTGDVLLAFDPGERLVELSYRSFAFSGSARNVTIRHLTVEQFASPAQHGAIYGDTSSGWTVVDNDVRFNSGAGITTGDFMRARSNRVVANGQIGIAGKGNDLLVESNDISENNTHAFDPAWEAGGTKFVRGENLIFARNCVRDNRGPGIWTDIDNRNSSIIGNWSVGNSGAGIFHEISGRATIAENTSALNGSREDSPWGSQILVSGSVDTLVWHNRIEVAADYGNGIFVVEEGRPNEAKLIHDDPQYVSRGNVIMKNEVTYRGAGGVSGFYSSKWNNESLASANIFEDNEIRVKGDELSRFRIGTRYRIGNKTMSLADAQGYKQELRSRLVTQSTDLQTDSNLKCPIGVGPRQIDMP